MTVTQAPGDEQDFLLASWNFHDSVSLTQNRFFPPRQTNPA